jgi:hypothetical protein
MKIKAQSHKMSHSNVCLEVNARKSKFIVQPRHRNSKNIMPYKELKFIGKCGQTKRLGMPIKN